MVGAALSKRCGALEAVHAALEIGEKAGYVLGGDNDGNEKTSEAIIRLSDKCIKKNPFVSTVSTAPTTPTSDNADHNESIF